MTADTHSVLLVTKDNKISSLIQTMLAPELFELTIAKDFNEARRSVNERNYNIIIVDSGDGLETDFAVDVSDSPAAILLLAPAHLFDQISYRVEAYGILTLTKPFDAFYFYNMIKVAIAVQYKIAKVSSQAVKLKEKMEEIRCINRAKMLLMENKKMSEEEAHHFIEKNAMDGGLKKIRVAENIIKELA